MWIMTSACDISALKRIENKRQIKCGYAIMKTYTAKLRSHW